MLIRSVSHTAWQALSSSFSAKQELSASMKELIALSTMDVQGVSEGCGRLFPRFAPKEEAEYQAFRKEGIVWVQFTISVLATVTAAVFWASADEWSMAGSVGDLPWQWTTAMRWHLLSHTYAVGCQWLLCGMFCCGGGFLRHADVVIAIVAASVFIVGISFSFDRWLRVADASTSWAVMVDTLRAADPDRSFGECHGSVGANATTSCLFRNYETSLGLVSVAYFASLALYCRLAPRVVLVLAHVVVAWYIACRGVWGTLDSKPLQTLTDAAFFYLSTIMLFLASRRIDANTRSQYRVAVVGRVERRRARALGEELARQHERMLELEAEEVGVQQLAGDAVRALIILLLLMRTYWIVHA